MATSTLGGLPPDIQLMICELLYETSPKSLLSLSLGNKSLYKSAEAFIFRDVTIHMSSPTKLQHYVKDLTQGKIGSKVQRHTRYIVLRDLASNPTFPHWERKPRYFLQRRPTIPYFPPMAVDAHPDTSGVWAPLVNLISLPRHLFRLTFSCGNKMPPCLWQALQQYHPTCKLTINFWWLQSLTEAAIDEDELPLLTLPCLDSICYNDRPADDTLCEYNQHALLQTIGLAQNLRQLQVSMDEASRTVVVPSWPGVQPPPVASWKKGQLKSLSISGYSPFDEDVLKIWTSATDFSKLEEFKCYSAISLSSLLPWCGQFSALRTLSMGFQNPLSDTATDMASLHVFFASLPALISLTALGSINTSALEAIAHRQGPTLRELYLTKPENSQESGPSVSDTWLDTPSGIVVTGSDLKFIAATCPALEIFYTTITRSQWNKHEMECYKALSTFRSLKELSISLDIGDDPPLDEVPPADWDSIDLEVVRDSSMYPRLPLRAGHFRELLSNAPMDDPLAWSIWSLVQPAHGGRQLKKLFLKGAPFRHRGLHFDALFAKVRTMQGHFTFETGGQYDGGQARMHGGDRERRSREWMFEKFERWENRQTDEEFEQTPVGKVMRRLWPPAEGRSWSWRDDYRSIPLQNSGT